MSDASDASPEGRTAADMPLPGGSFQLLVQRLAYQVLIGMGVLENPVTRTRETDTARARSVFDDLVMLREKTAGNLTGEESEHLESVIRDLDRHFDEISERAPS